MLIPRGVINGDMLGPGNIGIAGGTKELVSGVRGCGMKDEVKGCPTMPTGISGCGTKELEVSRGTMVGGAAGIGGA